MFPEIFRDEVFRLETRRLWLRWPTIGDAAGVGNDQDQAELSAAQDGSFAASAVAAWRSANASGAALHLILVSKPDQRPIGALHLVPDGMGSLELDGVLEASARGRGYMTEAIQGAARACFMLAEFGAIIASPAVDNGEGRAALEHCGFTYAGSGMRRDRNTRWLVPCDNFRLDHATWSSLQGWSMPGFGAYVANGASGCGESRPMTL